MLDARILSLARSVERLAQHIESMEQVEIEEMSTTYIALVNGTATPHTVTDTQNAGESDDDFQDRHNKHIAYDRANGYPIYH